MKKTNKKKIIITTIICLVITIGITVGIGFYNYSGYIEYKKDFLDDYFDVENNKKESNQKRIENAVRFTSNGYIANPGTLKYYDIGELGLEMNEITDKPLDSGDNINATFKDGTLHIPNLFDLNLYVQLNTATNDEGTTSTINYYLFISNIQYNYLYNVYPDFDPKNFFFTFVDGTDEESNKKITSTIEEVKENGDFDIGQLPSIWSYSLTTESDDVYAAYSLIDNTENVTIKDNEYPKIYRINITSTTLSVDPGDGSGKTKVSFGSENGVSFLLCYYDSKNGLSTPLIRGTYTAEMIDGKPITAETIQNVANYYTGYNTSYKNESYNSFIKPKIIKTCVITFVVSGIFTALLGAIWTIDMHSNKEKQPKNKKVK